SQVCGQCHSVWEYYDPDDERRAGREGLPYRPGGEPRAPRFIRQPPADRTSAEIRSLVAADPEFVRGSFWPDGTIRVSGREYNGLLDSPCFRDAESPERTLSCFSCHAMHKTPDDPRTVAAWADTHQVSVGMDGDEACLQCHEPLRADPAAHTRQAPESAGSRCYNCHMPYTSYGLLKAIRSHTVGSPSAAETVQVGRPNACNLCHLDKTMAWTAETLDEWYDIPVPPMRNGDRTVAAGLRWMLAGDAGLRALTAWSMGWRPAQEASGTTWMVPHLGEALGDPYDAVRFIAARSLRSLPGYANLDYDFVGPRQARVDTAGRVLREWRASPAARLRREPELLVDPRGELRVDAMRRLFDARDRRPLFLRE
ncbi:MAG: C cytochrome precursor, partial [Acidobacteria bacterium]|nr:C cytochrome precursor [Acidobacteriota bacterium]